MFRVVLIEVRQPPAKRFLAGRVGRAGSHTRAGEQKYRLIHSSSLYCTTLHYVTLELYALLHCTAALNCYTALLHCFTALLHCTTALNCGTELLRCSVALPFCTADLAADSGN